MAPHAYASAAAQQRTRRTGVVSIPVHACNACARARPMIPATLSEYYYYYYSGSSAQFAPAEARTLSFILI